MGSSSVQDEAEDVEEQPLVRHSSRRMSSGSVDTAKDLEEIEVSPPSSPQQGINASNPQHNRSDIHSDEVSLFSLSLYFQSLTSTQSCLVNFFAITLFSCFDLC